jgi:hypothetical protein
MTTVLGLLGVLAFIVGVIGLAALITWTVVKLTPPKEEKPAETEPSS